MSVYLGIDIGGTTIKIGLISEKFKLISKQTIDTRAKFESSEKIVSRMMDTCRSLLVDHNYTFEDVIVIGIGAPGTLINRTGLYTFAGNLPFDNYPLRNKVQEYYSGQVFLGNDANMAALAESRIGAGQGAANTVMITLGTGIGSGVIIKDRIYSGFNEAGAEIGHMVIKMDGEYCTCGRNGCWEAYIAAPALIRQTKQAIAEHPNSILAQVAQQENRVSGKTVFSAFDQGCPIADKVFKRYAYYLQIGMANVINSFMPEIIILGGGISNEGDRLIDSFQDSTLDEAFLFGDVARPLFRIATLGNDAGMLGAALFASDCLKDGLSF